TTGRAAGPTRGTARPRILWLIIGPIRCIGRTLIATDRHGPRVTLLPRTAINPTEGAKGPRREDRRGRTLLRRPTGPRPAEECAMRRWLSGISPGDVRKAAPRTRPAVEALEDRLALTTLPTVEATPIFVGPYWQQHASEVAAVEAGTRGIVDSP